MIKLLIFYLAQVAQLVEQATENRCVGGSIPPLGTTTKIKKILKVVPRGGIEPPTQRFSVACSTN